MFTGIIEETGTVKNIHLSGRGGTIEIACKKVLEQTVLGDSIAVNGICLTVTGLTEHTFAADAMNETLLRTSLSELKEGMPLNLERALTLSHRLGGHIVSGHIDATGKVLKIEDQGIAVLFTIGAEADVLEGIVEKGSVTLDGISLTVVAVTSESFTVSLIPHTVAHTNLRIKKIGSLVNLETDIIGKYVKKFLFSAEKKEENLMALLAENGFL